MEEGQIFMNIAYISFPSALYDGNKDGRAELASLPKLNMLLRGSRRREMILMRGHTEMRKKVFLTRVALYYNLEGTGSLSRPFEMTNVCLARNL